MKILVVDDSKAMRLMVQRALRQAGLSTADVQEAESGAQALRAIRANHPDLILSDWNMPDVSGLALLCALRAQKCETPFVFVTSETNVEMRKKAKAAGALGLISKPFDAEHFRDVLSPFLGR